MTQTLHAVGGADERKARTNAKILGVVRMIRSAYEVDADGLAELLGISRATVYERLKGRSAFYPGELEILAEHFRIPIERFFAGPDTALGRTPGQGEGHMAGYFPALLGDPDTEGVAA